MCHVQGCVSFSACPPEVESVGKGSLVWQQECGQESQSWLSPLTFQTLSTSLHLSGPLLPYYEILHVIVLASSLLKLLMKGLGDLSHSLQLWFWKKETMQIGVWQRHLALDCLISIFNGLIVIDILWFIKAIYELFCVIFLPHKSPKKWGGSCGCVWAKGALISLRPGTDGLILSPQILT